jgi:hypothetical protein
MNSLMTWLYLLFKEKYIANPTFRGCFKSRNVAVGSGQNRIFHVFTALFYPVSILKHPLRRREIKK